MSNLSVSSAQYAEDPLASVVSPSVMAGNGAYNQDARLPANGIAKALPLWETAAQRAALDGGAEPVVLADYGCSEGGNSLLPMEIAIRSLRRRMPGDRPISIFHIDQPANDFNCLAGVLNSHPSRYSLSQPNIFTYMIGKSFYDQVLPASSVHLGWSSYAAIWLSRVPALIPDHIFAACAAGDARAAFERQGAEDWETFLSMRAREMRPGARLVVVLPTTPDSGRHTFAEFMNVANTALEEMVHDGVITAEERRYMVLLSYARRKEELLSPFTRDGQFHRLHVEACEIQPIADPVWLDYQRDGDQHALARGQARFFRAVFTPSLAAGLDGNRQAGFGEELQERMMRRLMKDPTPAESAVQTIVLAKLEEK